MNTKEETQGNPETKKPTDPPVNELFSPVTFKLNDKEVRASKDVLMSASAYFKKMFTNGMKESTSDIISIQEEPAEFQILMDFLHFRTPFITASNAEVLCYFADKYQMENLKTQCEAFLLRDDSFPYSSCSPSPLKERMRISNKFRYLKPLQKYMDEYLVHNPDLSLKGEFCKEALIYLVDCLNQRLQRCRGVNSKLQDIESHMTSYHQKCSSYGGCCISDSLNSIRECLK
jgi:hypothetical protein